MKHSHQTSLIALFLVGAVVILVSPNRISSHEPVTTNIRFNKEVVRIFQRHCLACHQPGGPTTVSLDSYANARPWARAFKEEVLEKRMPPFQAVKGFGNFHDDYALTQHEIDQIVAWVEGGVPKGDDKDLPPNPRSEAGWIRGRPDLELPVKTEANTDNEIHRCIAVPTRIKRARWVTAIDFRPADAATVHCVSFAISNKAVSNSTDCESVGDSFGSWLPGQDLSDWPNGAARLLPAGSNLVMQVHYLKGSHTPAESSIGIYFAKSPTPRSLRTLSIRAANESVNPGEDRHRVTATYTLNRPADVLGIRPLLFPFAKSVEVTAYRPSGLSETLVWVQDYRYDWQPEYRFKEPVRLPLGTRVEVVAYLDNSDKNSNNPNRPARTIRFDSALCELFVVDTHPALPKKSRIPRTAVWGRFKSYLQARSRKPSTLRAEHRPNLGIVLRAKRKNLLLAAVRLDLNHPPTPTRRGWWGSKVINGGSCRLVLNISPHCRAGDSGLLCSAHPPESKVA